MVGGTPYYISNSLVPGATSILRHDTTSPQGQRAGVEREVKFMMLSFFFSLSQFVGIRRLSKR